jgi:membrane-associated phospholipid phosphatase
MKFKHHFRVRRPTDHSPLIQPVILTPSHGSYPAGHASQGNILVKVLTDLVGSKLGTDLPNQLQLLADRVSENRVVAGVHFEEDMTAGKALGQALGTRFLALAKTTAVPTTALQWLWTQAAAEWP